MSPPIRVLILLCSVLLPLLISCSSDRSIARPRASLFDEWPPAQTTNALDRMFSQWPSPSGRFLISYLKSDQNSDVFALLGRDRISAGATVLGYGLYSVNVKWFATRAGEIALIDHGISNGLNEMYVVQPYQFDGRVSWSLLLKTQDFRHTADGATVTHCYWSLVKLDPDRGSIRLKATWDFSDGTASPSGEETGGTVYTFMLFYGKEAR